MVKLGVEGARRVVEALAKKGIIDKKGRITTEGRERTEKDALELPPAYLPIANPIIAQIRAANRKIVVRDTSKEIVVRRKKQVFARPSSRPSGNAYVKRRATA